MSTKCNRIANSCDCCYSVSVCSYLCVCFVYSNIQTSGNVSIHEKCYKIDMNRLKVCVCVCDVEFKPVKSNQIKQDQKVIRVNRTLSLSFQWICLKTRVGECQTRTSMYCIQYIYIYKSIARPIMSTIDNLVSSFGWALKWADLYIQIWLYMVGFCWVCYLRMQNRKKNVRCVFFFCVVVLVFTNKSNTISHSTRTK